MGKNKKRNNMSIATMQMLSIILTDNQIKELPSSYVEIIAAPGVNKIIKVIAAVVDLNTVNGAYTNVDSDSGIIIVYEDWNAECTTLFKIHQGLDRAVYSLGQAGNDDIRQTWTGYSLGINTAEYAINSPIYLAGYNGNSGDFTGGNAANTLKITVYYVVVDL